MYICENGMFTIPMALVICMWKKYKCEYSVSSDIIGKHKMQKRINTRDEEINSASDLQLSASYKDNCEAYTYALKIITL